MNYLALALFCLWVLTELLSGQNIVPPLSETPMDRITENGEVIPRDFPQS